MLADRFYDPLSDEKVFDSESGQLLGNVPYERLF
jgi:hypothetical protein